MLAAKLLQQPPAPLSRRNTLSVSRTATAPKLILTTTPDTQNNLKTGSVAIDDRRAPREHGEGPRCEVDDGG